MEGIWICLPLALPPHTLALKGASSWRLKTSTRGCFNSTVKPLVVGCLRDEIGKRFAVRVDVPGAQGKLQGEIRWLGIVEPRQASVPNLFGRDVKTPAYEM